MLQILKQYVSEDGLNNVIEYTKDGKSVCARIETLISQQTEITAQPALEEMQAQTVLNTEYLVVMSELTNV